MTLSLISLFIVVSSGISLYFLLSSFLHSSSCSSPIVSLLWSVFLRTLSKSKYYSYASYSDD